VLSLLITKHIL